MALLFLVVNKAEAQNWNRMVDIRGDGVSEMGKYIDFHDTHEGLEDYTLRLSISGSRLFSTGGMSLLGLGVNTTSYDDRQIHIFGNSPSSTNLILSANYENSYRWKFKTTDRGNAIDLDIVGTNNSDQEEQIIKFSPSFSGRPELSFMNDWMVINNGNMGLGTISPTERLSVNGNIRSKEIKVEAKDWPDYVFQQDYQLPTLAEIEQQIKLNGHLTDMPSAKEVEINGIALGEMNKLLLKKVEELTLHLIEKEKQMEEQNRRLIQVERKFEQVMTKKY